ncbi:MAG TPA: hypothetical protein VLF15_12800 [Pseudoxanthomonas sp.]|nr:hypothetical protein [Pseudoxanthomonas sp.]
MKFSFMPLIIFMHKKYSRFPAKSSEKLREDEVDEADWPSSRCDSPHDSEPRARVEPLSPWKGQYLLSPIDRISHRQMRSIGRPIEIDVR